MVFKKCDKMPAAIVLVVCSWLVALAGFVAAGYRIISGVYRAESIFTAFLILLGSMVAAGLVRMVANIGQFLFEIRNQCFHMNAEICELKTNIREINTQVKEINTQARDLLLEQIGCDSKDMAQNINQIKVFFEQIERHLDLKK